MMNEFHTIVEDLKYFKYSHLNHPFIGPVSFFLKSRKLFRHSFFYFRSYNSQVQWAFSDLHPFCCFVYLVIQQIFIEA